MFDTTFTAGDVTILTGMIGLMILVVKLTRFYSRQESKFGMLLARHDERIEAAEKDIEQNSGDIRDLYKLKVDKKRI